MANLFDKAKKAAPKAEDKNKKVEVIIKEPAFYTSLSHLADITRKLDELEAEQKILSADVKERSIKAFEDLYEQTGAYPGSFNIKATDPKKDAASMLFIPSDKYITINEERATELRNGYGDDIVTESTVYTMDADLIEKYGEIISDLILNCKKITKEDKDKLISASTKFSIKKGTITELKTKYSDVPLNEVIMDIKPVFMIKGVKIES